MLSPYSYSDTRLQCIAHSAQPWFQVQLLCLADDTFAVLKGEENPASFAGQDREATGLQRSLAGELHLLLVAASKDGCLQSPEGCGFAVLIKAESARRDRKASKGRAMISLYHRL